MPAKGKFKYGNESVQMELTWSFATGKLEDLGIDVLSILSDGGATMNRILLDDRTMLKVWYHYVNEYTNDDWDKAIETLDETQGGLEQFRDEFLSMVVNFSPAPARKLLSQMIQKVKEDMKDSRKVKSLLSSSNSAEGSEDSIQEDTPLES